MLHRQVQPLANTPMIRRVPGFGNRGPSPIVRPETGSLSVAELVAPNIGIELSRDHEASSDQTFKANLGRTC